MRKASVVLRHDVVIGDTDPRLFGAFVEHLGRCVYGGIYEPGHPTADEQGFRSDVLALVRELAPDHHALSRRQLRLGLQLGGRRRPGGGAAAPARPRLDVDRAQHLRHQRIHRLVPRWPSIEPMLAVNLGTRGGDAARNLRRVLQPSRRHRAVRPAPRARLGAAARRQVLVPGQRDGRPLADGGQDRRRNTAASPPRRPR